MDDKSHKCLLDPLFVQQNLKRALTEVPSTLETPLPKKTASVALICCMKDDHPGIICIERASNPNDPWSGHMGFPGGHTETKDLSSKHTAERETEEEIGVPLKEMGEHLGKLNAVQARNKHGLAPFKIIPHVYWIHTLPSFKPNKKEVNATYWIALEYFLAYFGQTTFELEAEQGKVALPGIAFQNKVIWGLSYRILEDLLTRLHHTPLVAEIQKSRKSPSFLITDPHHCFS